MPDSGTDCTRRLQAVVGNVLRFAVPDDTFHDREDGDTSNLQLLFLTFRDDLSVAPHSWIQLNHTSRTLYGLPLPDDVGRHRYVLAAADSSGRIAKMAFEVDVVDSDVDAEELSHEFSVLLDLDYQQFLYKVSPSSSVRRFI